MALGPANGRRLKRSLPPDQAAKKRTKTFTGCSTCRQRSLKCGLERPACLRCQWSGMRCGGYGVRLTWPGEDSGTGRRYMLEPALSRRPILSEDAVDQALSCIESADGENAIAVDLFSVFRLGKHQPEVVEDPRTTCSVIAVASDSARFAAGMARALPTIIFPALNSSAVRVEHEKLLMHHWTCFLSGAMTAFPRPDNAFRDIITPRALSALTFNSNSPAHLALLAALYALAAASKSTLREEDFPAFHRIHLQYLNSSTHYLNQALSSTDFEEQQAILATIMLLVVIPAFTGDSSDWRVHLRGADLWLNTVDLDQWRCSRSAATLYQLFSIVASLRPVHRRLANGLPLPKRRLQISATAETVKSPQKWINQYVSAEEIADDNALNELELAVYRSDPRHVVLKSPTTMYERMAHAHTMLFHYACHIYFGSALRRRTSSAMQYFVTCAIAHIEEITQLETGLDVSGIMWPAFITACAAENPELRSRTMQYFIFRERLGIANVTNAKQVTMEVWRRQDEAGPDTHISWQEVMADLKIDIILS
ncbi:fungal-specific transcription factor domain-containing protein [Neohortaea acidophila]|uniref:Fungal-specific transcription factor domain-containing protein n=1 Tax=Neohortaea acidophila TaxID=245834 RepID=A0A6A6PTJ3_9PEZI|nr:fungal-specific transcription factor domain-containing protein [Neohortaea acidophila]KAF2482783.1 fungal-specific transcription factor domain-containing protein [Neohortaea acidophila]